MPLTQANRAASITTPLGSDVLLLQSFQFNDSLSQPFQVEVSLISESWNTVKADDIVGKKVTITLEMDDSGTVHRYINGYVSRFAFTGMVTKTTARYSMTVVPLIWFMGLTSDCKIRGQQKSISDIVQDTIKGFGFTDITNSLTETYSPREYCVQYRETSLNFVSRRMEEEGIYYFFKHANGTHNLVLADGPSAHAKITTLYVGMSSNALGTDTVTSFVVEQQARSSSYTMIDYNFTTPSRNLQANTKAQLPDAVAGTDLMDYPGGYADPSIGTAWSKVRVEEAQAMHKVARGQTGYRGLFAGAIFTLKEHPIAEYNIDWLVTSVSLNMAMDDFATGGGNGDGGEAETHFACSFTAIPAQVTFRPPRVTPEPFVSGPQPAIVVGPSGEEIYTDKYGRIKVQFYWDRIGTKDENSSMYVRVGQSLAGKNFGSIFLPRIGHEVLVQFTEGNPDRPVVIGSVYNAENMPPYTLPDNQTQSGIKTNSSKGGGGSNELRFEDKKGSEDIFLHAQKDLHAEIENDCAEKIGHDHTIEVDNDQTEHVKHDRTETVDNDHTETIKNNRNLTVKAKETIEVDGDHSETVKGDVSQTYQGNHTEQTTKDYSLKAENITLEANTKLTLKMGNSTIVIDSGGVKISTDQNLNGEAQQQVTIKGQTGVTVQSSTNLDIKATAQLGLEGTAQAELKGAVAKVTGQAQAALTAAGQVQVQGGIVMIN